MSLINVKRKSIDLTNPVEISNLCPVQLQTKHSETECKMKRKNSWKTTYEEIVKTSAEDTMKIETISQADEKNTKLWGFIILKCIYNKKRENMTINFVQIKPNSSYWKIKRKHEFIVYMFGHRHQHWHSGHFKLSKMNPPVSEIIIENLLVEKIKTIHFEIKLFRSRKRAHKRLLGEAEIQMTEICTSNQIIKIPLQIKYQDKPPKLIEKTKEEKETVPKQEDKDEVDCFTDEFAMVEVKCCDMLEPIPEIHIGLKYDPIKSILIVNIEKCFNIFIVKGSNAKIPVFYIKCIVEPENYKFATIPSKKSHCPIIKERFKIPILKENLEVGKITLYIMSKNSNKKLFFANIDRTSDEFWKEVLFASSGTIFRWLELENFK